MAAERRRLWDGVLELMVAAQERDTEPLIWASRLSSSLAAAGVPTPSVEVAELLVSHICWSNNTPIAWKILEKALTVRIVPPLFVLALLSNRVILSRRRYPVAYRLYMELLRRYSLSLPSLVNGPNHQKPTHWDCFSQHLRLLSARSTSLRSSNSIYPEALLQLTSDTWRVLSRLVKALQALNKATWQDAFLGLWTAALRIVQRERNLFEGPDPRIEIGLILLLSILPLSIVNIIDEEEIMLSSKGEKNSTSQRKHNEFVGKRREHLVCSLKLLGDFEELLTPPSCINSLANQAAMKAMMFLSGVSIDNEHLNEMMLNDVPNNCSGNLRHLIVESCIARNVLDTSAYTWPGYVKSRCNQHPQIISGQMPGWSSLMSGSPLTPPLIRALASTPATSLAEIERIYEIAVGGTDDEKIAAATILSGASLGRGWSIQEHTCLLITKLLSPSVPPDYSGRESHLIGYAPILNALVVGILSITCVQIFSMHGLVPLLATALMPICEVFGSLAPCMSWTLNTGEVISSHSVFSNAFIILLKLWKFDHPPMVHGMGDGPPVGSNLTLEYLLSLYNSQLASHENLTNKITNNRPSRLLYPSRAPVFMDFFPKLKHWYRKHQECIVATPILAPGDSIHQVVETLLSIMFRKINKGGQTLTSTTSGSSNSSASGPGPDDSLTLLNFPTWDILEALPFVLDAALTASANERISPRELITGLKCIVDILPASLVTIFSYYSAEVSRGLWKHASMNGVDWPSPGANLSMIERQTNNILAANGVKVPCPFLESSSPISLPLPLAALIGLIITYKLNRDGRSYLQVIRAPMTSLAVSCPRPCMSIMAAIWAQKSKKWPEYLIGLTARSIFHHDSNAMAQLLRACFAVHGAVGPLLGHDTFGSQCSAPGRLYFRVHRSIRSLQLLTKQVVSVLMDTVVTDISRTSGGPHHDRFFSFVSASTRVKTAASLGASLVWITGGPGSVETLVKEILPCWFISCNNRVIGPAGRTLCGHALAYFSMFCGLFAWGLDSRSAASRRRRNVLGAHFEFLAGALDGKISLGCDEATWRAYVTGYLDLVISCAPKWLLELNVEVLKRIGKGLRRRWNEDEMAVALLMISGFDAMGAAAEMIIETAV
ncbi:Mediator of RNA polymerase II transcription subunit 33A [Striga hermonthica]|uniref:Mediator of RNA polymerase II transcription subunit 33A n=1 Tax=Striga hermonthica TaxID=68872 RepID=A0A9N7NAQ4_STRHE|nr:Mediator of RNA polymerase II transcription subunit 33A [Striga hermonthica]